MLSLLSSSKNFHDRWIGHPQLNKIGLHTYRMKLAQHASHCRTALQMTRNNELTASLHENGYVVIPDFLSNDSFETLSNQVKEQVTTSINETPPSPPTKKGFGRKEIFQNGFDRYDGSTLNRFLDTNDLDQAILRQVTQHSQLDTLCRKVSGFTVDSNRLLIYLTMNSDGRDNPDNQKVLHRDTFHSSLKFWYYLEDVNEDDGPFIYVPGSHRLTQKRLAWEHRQALISCGLIQDTNALNHGGGSFRVHQHELDEMGYAKPISFPVAKNTLILADTLGFHRRGDAIAGTQRLALYGWRRPWPFLLKGW